MQGVLQAATRTRNWVAALVILLSTAFIVVVSPARPAQAIGGMRAAIMFPFDNGGRTWISGQGPGHHYTGFYAWSMDLHAAEDTLVKARFQSTDGAVTLKVLAVDELQHLVNGQLVNCSPSAGKYVTLEVKVGTTIVGRVVYQHLQNVPAGIS